MVVTENTSDEIIVTARNTTIERLPIAQRVQHFLQLVSFLILSATGLAMKFIDNSASKQLTELIGGFDRLLAVHLIAGAVITWTAFYHILYLLHLLSERKLQMTLLPNKRDFRDFALNMRYLLGFSDHKPSFGKYSYKEKVDYLAEWWGMFVMIGTGLLLWFPGQLGRFVPRWMLDVAQVFHSYEAALAILVIVVWHLFATVWSPHIFPGSKVWLTGKMTLAQMLEEHPLQLNSQTHPEDIEFHPATPFRIVLAFVQIMLYLGVFLLLLKAFLPGALS